MARRKDSGEARSAGAVAPETRLVYEEAFWRDHPGACLAGVDEAGRGCLAGSVVAGAVSIDEGAIGALARDALREVTDSKQLTPARRERLYQVLTTHPQIRWAVGEASPEEIDRLNILNATHLAMARAVQGLSPLPAHALVDGLPVKHLPIGHTAIVKGDARSLLIACASIVAKVTRDHLCAEWDKLYPGYGFAQNKTYGTAQHVSALRELGACPIHRRSFEPVALVQEELGLQF